MPGLALTAALGVVAWGAARAAGAMYPRAGIDAVVLAILAGVIVRAVWHPAPWAVPGIGIAARQVLEVAIVLLGVATDARWMARAGLELALAIAADDDARVRRRAVVGTGLRAAVDHMRCSWRRATPSAATRPSLPSRR